MTPTTRDETDSQRIVRQDDIDELSRHLDAPAQGSSTVIGATTAGVKFDEQRIVIVGKPTGGVFTLKGLTPLGAPWLVSLPFNATVAQVQTALRAIYGAGNVACTGSNILGTAGGVNLRMIVRFGTNGTIDGTLIYTPIAGMTADLANLTPIAVPYEFRNFHFAVGEPQYPTIAQTWYRLNLATARPIYALNVGSGIPPVGTTITARQVKKAYVFTYG